MHAYIHTYMHTYVRTYSGITSGRVLKGELLYTKILEVNLFAFAYRLFRRISPHSTGHIAIFGYTHTHARTHAHTHTERERERERLCSIACSLICAQLGNKVEQFNVQ